MSEYAVLVYYLIPGLIADDDEHGPMVQLHAILYHHPNTVIYLLFHHFSEILLRQRACVFIVVVVLGNDTHMSQLVTFATIRKVTSDRQPCVARFPLNSWPNAACAVEGNSTLL